MAVKKTKMTADRAAAIAAEILIMSVPPQITKLMDERWELTKRVRDELFPADAMALIAKLPKHLRPAEKSTIDVQYSNNGTMTFRLDGAAIGATDYMTLIYEATQISETLGKNMREAMAHKRAGEADLIVAPVPSGRSYRPSAELQQAVAEHYEASMLINTSKEVVTKFAQLKTLLRKFKTVDEVEESWPEAWSVAQNHLEKVKEKPQVFLPSISIARLNAELGLPV